jgi:hypothetical protein
MKMRDGKMLFNGRGYDSVEGYPLLGSDMHVGIANHIVRSQ